jgi:hypothetical protein
VTEIADLAPCTYWPKDSALDEEEDPARFYTAIGFLGETVPRSDAPPLPADFAKRLMRFELSKGISPVWAGLGYYSCGVCSPGTIGGRGAATTVRIDNLEARLGSGFLVVPGPHTLYVAPNLIIHYILTHGYRPPEEFVRAVERWPTRSSAAYLREVRRLAPPLLRWADSFDDYAPAPWRIRVARWIWGEADAPPAGIRRLLWRLIRRW